MTVLCFIMATAQHTWLAAIAAAHPFEAAANVLAMASATALACGQHKGCSVGGKVMAGARA